MEYSSIMKHNCPLPMPLFSGCNLRLKWGNIVKIWSAGQCSSTSAIVAIDWDLVEVRLPCDITERLVKTLSRNGLLFRKDGISFHYETQLHTAHAIV
jgi:hypothetical protein